MEHKILQGGGEQYLPFARSRIKALRATGLKYASQRFEVGDSSVSIQIVGDQEYIRIIGGKYDVLSGVTKDGEVVTLPVPPDSPPGTEGVKVLRSYRPTEQAWKYLLKKDPAKSPLAYNDEPRLSGTTDQYTRIFPSSYSGLMAKAVQVMLGYGKQADFPSGLPIVYERTWVKTHGISTGADGKKWLIEISADNGVLAMRLPLIKGTSGFGSSPQKVLSKSVKAFGGLPSGGTFPTGAALTAAITAGTVLRLKTAAEMSDFHYKYAANYDLGWSFNDTGTEAHNTCYDQSGSPLDTTCYHYKLTIDIGAINKDRTSGQPIATATATLSLVESGVLYRSGTANVAMAFYRKDTETWQGIPARTLYDPDPLLIPASSAPVLVCHINGVLDVVRVVSNNTALNEDVSSGENLPYGYTYSHQLTTNTKRYVTSTRYPIRCGVYEITRNIGHTEHLQQISYELGGGEFTRDWYRADERFATSAGVYVLENTPGVSHAVWSPYARDSYTMDIPAIVKSTTTAVEHLYYKSYGLKYYHAELASLPTSATVTEEIPPVPTPNFNAWGDGVFTYTPPLGVISGSAWDAAFSTMTTIAAENPGLGSGGFAYPTTESNVLVYDVNTPRTLAVVPAGGNVVYPGNLQWNVGLDYDWDNIEIRPYPFHVRYSVFGDSQQIAYPTDTTGASKTSVLGTMFLGDTNPNSAVHTYDFLGYI